MTVPEKVFRFLKKHTGMGFCDDCIAEKCELKTRQESATVTATLSLCEEFEREKGTCGGCLSQTKLVTNAN